MKKISISDIDESIVFFDIYGILQNWNKKSVFSYMSSARPNHGFMYILCDSVNFEYYDGSKETYKQGSLLYIPKGLRYKVTFSDKNDEFTTLLLNFSISEDAVFYDRITLLVSSASAKYTDEFYNIISYYKNTKNNYFSIMASFFTLLDNISKHIEKRTITNREYKIIEPAVTYIDSHINENLNIPDLAGMCHVSESCFRNYFKKYTGRSPIEYITDIKLEKSKRMLKSPDIPIQVISAELGFYDCSYFYKMFKKKNHITPAQFRQSHNI